MSAIERLVADLDRAEEEATDEEKMGMPTDDEMTVWHRTEAYKTAKGGLHYMTASQIDELAEAYLGVLDDLEAILAAAPGARERPLVRALLPRL